MFRALMGKADLMPMNLPHRVSQQPSFFKNKLAAKPAAENLVTNRLAETSSRNHCTLKATT